MNERLKKVPYFTWGCSDDLAFRLTKTLYCSEEDGCFDSSSAALTDVAVSMLKETATKSRRRLSHRYASSLTRQLSISPCALMMSILYSERLRQLNPGYLEKVSSSDLYVIAMLVATKFLHDEGEQEEIYNDEWAEAAGLAVSTVNRLEREFLDAMDWNIYVHPEEFLDFCSRIETKIALKYGIQRGWFSYTDLTQFLLEVNYQNVLKGILERTVKVIGGCALIYGMSLSILISSVITYAASTTANKFHSSSSLSTHHTNVTSPLETPVSTTPFFLSYAERKLTRERLSIDTTAAYNDVGVGKEIPLEDEKNETNSETSGVESLLTSCKCGAGSPSFVCFEPSFQRELHQTNIFYGLDTIDLHLCNNQKYAQDRNMRGGGGCPSDDWKNEETDEKRWTGNGFGLTSRKLRNSHQFTQLPTMFGMAVM